MKIKMTVAFAKMMESKFKLKSASDVTIKYDWKQSTFIPNCPIYYVENTLNIGNKSKFFMRIEHLVKTDVWIIELMGGVAKLTESGKMLESDRIKKLAESEMTKLVKLLNNEQHKLIKQYEISGS